MTRDVWAYRAFGIACLGLALLAFGASAATAGGTTAKDILAATGVEGGLVVHLGCGDGTLTAALHANDRTLVHGLDPDPASVEKARRHIQSLGLAGKVCVDRWTPPGLPYIDNLVNLLVASGGVQVAGDEVMRVLAPGGVAYVGKDGGWTKTVKPRPKAIDDWTHFLHDAGNNAVARDSVTGPPRHMQWLADPQWCRNHHTLASISSVVSAGGRLFHTVDEGPAALMSVPGKWSLVGRDAFSGVLLWKRAIAAWAWHRRGFRSGPVQLPRTLVAEGDRVYTPLGIDAPVSCLDAATGQTVRAYKGTENAEELVVHGGVLCVVLGSPFAEQAMVSPERRKARFPNAKAIVALRAQTGDVLWKWTEAGAEQLTPLTLAAEGPRVFFQAGRRVLCRDRDTGKELWRSEPVGAATPGKQAKGKKRRRGLGQRSVGWSLATLVVHDGVVLLADGPRLSAMAAETGKPLWNCPSRPGFRSPADVFVIRGLVWLGPDFAAGRDLRTGEVKQSNHVLRDLWSAGHHHRCYREKATDRYILSGHRGIEFLDLAGDSHSRNNWIRGLCQYGVMPCNGLIYAPGHACGCYMEAKLFGFWALAPARGDEGRGARDAGGAARLERGPAYGEIRNAQSAIRNGDWPTYRRDPLRSATTAAEVPAQLRTAWQAAVGGRLSAPVVAGGLVLVSAIDAYRVVALDARTGKPRWAFTAGGRVDSPPTVHGGLALFGCADGWVYCLRATDGALAWRFRAAPAERRTVARDRVESLWPVHGSVLVHEGVAYVAAGRSSYLDGGIYLYGLDPATGKVVCETRVRSRHPKGTEGADKPSLERISQNTVDSKTLAAPDLSDSFSMAGGATTDVLVSDGTSIYLRQVRFDRKLVRQGTGGRHLFSTSRLLDGAEVHRSHWVLGTADFRRIPVAYSWIANSLVPRWGVHLAAPYGLLLAFDAQHVWGVRRSRGYLLYADRNQPFSPDETPLPDFRKSTRKGPPPWTWSTQLPMRPRTLVRAGPHLLLGGMPSLPGDQGAYDVLAGRKGGVLWVASAADGKRSGCYALPAPPVWDGMAVAGVRLYVATIDGSVLCLASEGKTPLKPYAAAAAASVPAAPAGRAGRPGAPVRPGKDGKLVLEPETARTTGRLRYQPDRNNLGAWTDPADTCAWNLQGVKAGTYAVDFAYGTTRAGVGYTVVVGQQQLAAKTRDTGGLKTYKSFRVGTIALPAGTCTLAVKPGPFTGAIMNFRLLTLTPVP